MLKAPIAGNRPAAVDMIVIHHTAGNLQGDLNTFLYENRVSIHYLVAPNGDGVAGLDITTQPKRTK